MLSSIPMGRYAEPEEVGWAVRFLASPEAGYITGQTLIVDGGQVLPEALTRAMIADDACLTLDMQEVQARFQHTSTRAEGA